MNSLADIEKQILYSMNKKNDLNIEKDGIYFMNVSEEDLLENISEHLIKDSLVNNQNELNDSTETIEFFNALTKLLDKSFNSEARVNFLNNLKKIDFKNTDISILLLTTLLKLQFKNNEISYEKAIECASTFKELPSLMAKAMSESVASINDANEQFLLTTETYKDIFLESLEHGLLSTIRENSDLLADQREIIRELTNTEQERNNYLNELLNSKLSALSKKIISSHRIDSNKNTILIIKLLSIGFFFGSILTLVTIFCFKHYFN